MSSVAHTDDLRVSDPHRVGEILAEPGVPIVGHCLAVVDLPLARVQALAAELGAVVGYPPAHRSMGCRRIIVPPTAPRYVRRAMGRILRPWAPSCAAALRRCGIPQVICDYDRRQVAVHDLRPMAPGGDA